MLPFLLKNVTFFTQKCTSGCVRISKKLLSETVVRCSVKRVSLGISENTQKNTCGRVSLMIKLQGPGPRPVTLLEKKLWHRCFPVSSATFFIKHLRWLLLFHSTKK